MGPRPDGRGKIGPRGGGVSWSVNGAAARRPRKARVPPGQVAACRRQWGRGQTAAESGQTGRQVITFGERQWGRGQTAAERALHAAVRRPALHASMGPRPDGRGKAPQAVRQDCADQASMGPRPDGRGKGRVCDHDLIRHVRQWGRGQTAAESGRQSCAARTAGGSVNGAAARRPRKASLWRLLLSGLPASMGPRPDGRGK